MASATATATPDTDIAMRNSRTGLFGTMSVADYARREEARNAEIGAALPPGVANDTQQFVAQTLTGDDPVTQQAVARNLNRLSLAANEMAQRRFANPNEVSAAQIDALTDEVLNGAIGRPLMNGMRSRTPHGVGGAMGAATKIGFGTTTGFIGGAAKGVAVGLAAGIVAKLWYLPAKLFDKVAGTNISSALKFKNTIGWGTALFGGIGALQGLARKSQSSVFNPIGRNNDLDRVARQAVQNSIRKALAARRQAQAGQSSPPHSNPADIPRPAPDASGPTAAAPVAGNRSPHPEPEVAAAMENRYARQHPDAGAQNPAQEKAAADALADLARIAPGLRAEQKVQEKAPEFSLGGVQGTMADGKLTGALAQAGNVSSFLHGVGALANGVQGEHIEGRLKPQSAQELGAAPPQAEATR